MKKVTVLGQGYIGLPTSVVLAESGFDVYGFDINKERVEAINRADPTIQEPEIYPRLKKVLDSYFFKSYTDMKISDYFIIAVPTPITREKKADLSYVFSAAESVCKVLKKGDTVILESTSPVGTTQKLAELIQKMTSLIVGIDIFVGYSPERVLPGNIFHELIYNDRVIGGIDEFSTKKIIEFYRMFVKGEIVATDSKTAEMVKLVENSSRDVEIAFAHQVASMAYEAGINPYELIAIANKHPRVKILNPRCGVGGHCIAVDPWFLIESFSKSSELLKIARQINDAKPYEIINFIETEVEKFTQKNSLKPKVAILGLTYKPNIDDLRESPALEIAHELVKKDFDVLISDPNILSKNLPLNLKNKFFNYEKALDIADIVVLLVGHREFLSINWSLHIEKKLLDFSGLNVQKNKEFYHETNIFGKRGASDKRSL